MLSDYQTRVFEAFAATLRQNLPALRGSLDELAAAVRNPHGRPDESVDVWLQLEQVLNHLDLLDHARDHIVNSSYSRAGVTVDVSERPKVIRRIRSTELRKVLELLHAIAGTPIEGYISQEGS